MVKQVRGDVEGMNVDQDIKNIVILTGAGVSAESGIDTFRSAGGLWEQHKVEDVATPEAFARDPDLVLRFYDMRRERIQQVEPNAAHYALARLDAAWAGELLLVTQNVDDLHERAGGVDKDGDLAVLIAASDIVVDFSNPHALEVNLDACVAAGKPIVIGTTGLEELHHFLIDDAARDIPVLQTGNTSVGVTMLAALVEQAARQLGEDWDIEILEMHHRHKVDAPSGTALLLGEAAAKGRAVDLKDHSDRARDGITGGRKAGNIGFASLRGGSVAGDHMVIFASDNERIELVHRAENRAIFANGAVKAAVWLMRQKAGRYNMQEVLGL